MSEPVHRVNSISRGRGRGRRTDLHCAACPWSLRGLTDYEAAGWRQRHELTGVVGSVFLCSRGAGASELGGTRP